MMKKILGGMALPIIFAVLSLVTTTAAAQNYRTDKDVSYVPSNEKNVYRQERCKLDVYYPSDKKGFSTIVWFHGGGLEGGSKFIPSAWKEKGIAVVAVNYRLSPKAKNPAYTLDAAEAVAWVYKHIENYGGRRDRIFVTGHSAGGYLALILAMDKHYLAADGVDADSIAAYLPISGQTVTHFTIRKERGLPDGIPVIDNFAPVNNARKDTPPIVLITGDRHLEMASRYEENALLESVLRNLGNTNVSLYEMQGFDHGSVVEPACFFISNYVKNFGKK
jgi:acetyl esterase/lipase